MLNKSEYAEQMARDHVRVEPTISKVVRVVSKDEELTGEPIKLLEVNSATVPDGIVPIFFGATDDFPFPLVIIEVTPDEFDMIKSQKLPLRSGWSLDKTLVQMPA